MRTSMPAATSMRPHAPPVQRPQPAATAAGVGPGNKSSNPGEQLDERTRAFYLRSMDVLDRCGVPYCVGGAYALAHYTGIVRHTKDLDFFLLKDDLPRAVEAFERAGYRTEFTHPHWLAKAYESGPETSHGAAGAGQGPHACGAFIDLYYGAGNGIAVVDDARIANAVPGEVLGRRAPLCPAEEMLWSKAFIMERDRFDGADVNHLLLARGPSMDWRRLLARFGTNGRVLLAHLVLFGFVYPSERNRVPPWVLETLLGQMKSEPPPEQNPRVCRGTLLSWQQYLPDVRDGRFEDARLQPSGSLTSEQVERWTAAEK
jgi:hypothetical protein